MNLVIRAAKILDPTSKHHKQSRDILIQKGVISQIAAKVKAPKDYKVVSGERIFVSPGWVDMYSFLGDPGFEYKEDLSSGSKAAASGGFTTVCCMPNTQPALDSKSEIEYILNKSNGNLVAVKPIGAVSKDCEGKDITEIYDMRQAGAIAFSDGINSSLSAGLMLRGLLYVKSFGGLVISHPDDRTIRNAGVVNEGIVSTSLGVKGIPSISEEIIVMRDIYLAEYANSRLHLAYVSSAGSVDLIREAKAKGINVTCSVSPYNLMMDEEFVTDYDTNFKVLPPLKTKTDIKALVRGLKDGTIDNIASFHIPQDVESKKVEFDYAEFGMISLETAYAVVNTAVGKQLGAERIVEKLAIRPRQILDLDVPSIQKGSQANLTIFDDSVEWEFSEKDIYSKSKNSPFVGHQLKGRVLGVVNNNKSFIN